LEQLQSEIANCARILIKDCGNVVAGETVCLIADSGQDHRLLEALSLATKEMGAHPVILQYESSEESPDPPKQLVEKLIEADFILVCTTVPFNKEYLYAPHRKGARILGATRVTLESLLRIVPIDYEALSFQMNRIGGLIEKSSRVRIEAPNGTNFLAKIAPWGMTSATSIVTSEGDWAHLPAGANGIGLVDGSAEGSFVADGIIDFGRKKLNIGKIMPPITLVIKKGVIVETHCSEKGQLDVVNEWLYKDKGANAVVEIGVGFNPKATFIGEPEGERVLGAVHIGTGDNHAFGGENSSKSHLDIIILNATLYSDDQAVVRNGKI
jgi:2,5-dihydroxypyridine 5,6-dioxygenase